jgi:poly(A) polymerase
VQPKIYSLKEHNIAPHKIDNHAYYIIEKLRSSGYIAYLVGGSVRDLLLNTTPKDFDISTSAKPEEIKKLFRNCILIGRRFRLAHIRFGKKIFEVSTFRAGDNEDSSLILRDNVWGDPEEDVLRRDFTINGLFYDTETQTVIDYVGGFNDARAKIIRTIGKANIRFVQDPVRMIRLLKFLSRFDLSIDKDTLSALDTCKEEIIKSSSARILEELLRMLESGVSKDFFQLLTKHGLLNNLSPLLSNQLQEEKDNKILIYLNEVDEFHKNALKHLRIERTVLLSCLIFPILEERLLSQYVSKNKRTHLGIIFEETQHLINEIFSPFFLVPRRMKAIMTSILLNQFRFIPLDKTTKRRIRIPKDQFFSYALKFLELRCKITPELDDIYKSWSSVANKHGLAFHPKKSNKYHTARKKRV